MKSYLRYSLSDTFGLIASSQSSVVYDSTSNLAISAALHQVAVCNLRQGTIVKVIKPEFDDTLVRIGQIKILCLSPNKKFISAGYSNGIIRTFDLTDGTTAASYNGHRSSVTACRYDSSGDRLISGGADTDLVLWDIVAERGECRLKGHRDGVTDVAFLPSTCIVSNGAVSCSKDSFFKIWDLDTQHCIQTVVGHQSEIWTLDISPCGKRLATGAADSQLRVWSLVSLSDSSKVNSSLNNDEGKAKDDDMLVAIYMGSVPRSCADKGKIHRVRFHPNGKSLVVQGGGGDKAVEIFRIRTKDEAEKKRKRRLKRRKQKLEKEEIEEKIEEDEGTFSEHVTARDEMESCTVIRSHNKVCSFALSSDAGKGALNVKVLLGLQNNSLEFWKAEIKRPSADLEAISTGVTEKIYNFDRHGHRGDIRTVGISSDGRMLASVGKGEAKLWNGYTKKCVRTVPCGFGLCCAFAPGDRHLIIGTKEGKIEMIDLSSGDQIGVFEAHEGAVWSIDVTPDGSGMASGSADGQVKFFEFEIANKNLSIVHTRTIKMADDVLCVRYSRGRGKAKRLIAVAVLDATVKVFHEDSLKFFLSLYGHKLPVMSMDISDDGSLLATGSADRTVKLWGLDFGDCHRSIQAHTDSVMGLKFLPGTHLFFTASKDKTIKMWDADRFEKVLTLEGHEAEIWGLAVSPDGAFLLTGSHDRSLRIWERSEDMVFVEEEKEKELERMFDSELERDDKVAKEASNMENEESGVAGRRGVESALAGEQLIEALELVIKYGIEARLAEKARRKAVKDGKSVPTSQDQDPFLLGMAPDDRFLSELVRIKPSDLEQALLVLPLAHVEPLSACLARLLKRGLEVELCARCTILLLKIHQNTMAAGPAGMLRTLEDLRMHLRTRVEEARDVVGVNIAGMKLLKRRIEERKDHYLTDEMIDSAHKKTSRIEPVFS